ncbi:NADH-quinone oxidoreductase subunit D [Candidatus Korarchaeum cryptofilum]|jgi:NADH-quinone oxidoreductase subunit D|uniref:NADH-quinone oxidoreductase subunit D n=1 Tax=Candidatus Korarchaeum cryptofilum TaxID=498846 RepID=A0A429G6C1_9CREN|nr:NADH-quinone oxidoreductase subunit D [Candidatus Korarchaeum cryptofilum]RSN69311.1 NADH-quinone oxidoreductase subunit D [Candidatus Korarchaeum cryptofilum]
MSLEERTLELLIGPQHPASGHMRLVAKIDGDIVVELRPNIGYVHRSVEKLAEVKKFLQIIPLVERPSLADTTANNLAYVMALEKLLGIDPPERAKYLRTLLAEINRIHSHLYGLGIHGVMIGSSTAYMWCFGDREPFLELAQELTGARLTYSYIIPGGVRRDLPKGFAERAEKALKYLEGRMKDYFDIYFNNPVVRARLEGVGVLSKEDAIKLGVTGPNLRASGVAYDVRRAEPYAAYPNLDFDVITEEEGDCYARVMVRVREIMESIKIIRQVLKEIPEGPIIHESYEKLIPPKLREEMKQKGIVKFPSVFANLRVPAGEAISRVEGGRGEVVFHVISDGKLSPYRMRMVTPSFRNVILFEHLTKGARVADIPAIYGSLDYFPPEADR